ncbi:hypothetical protein GGR93_000701 [Sulfitobacter noctilucicola]|uniref:Uncharacterized protein n=1 Tax=Sulfitobacter noctilucicola TaxID=1342301 RepID=A0A7W6Q2C7_9RHOB|nr:hypothetical protein [Sulfitobacter noctilucicola]
MRYTGSLVTSVFGLVHGTLSCTRMPAALDGNYVTGKVINEVRPEL